MQLKDRVAIVTGAARGIGQEYCVALAREGARVVAADVLPSDKTVARVREETQSEAIGVIADVSDNAATQALAAEATGRFGRIDILVNNAAKLGDMKLTPFDRIAETDWDAMMAVNVKGCWHCSKAVIPAMKRLGKGRIINIASGTILRGAAGQLHYVTSKGAIWAFTRALARELAGTGINVNTITPGFTVTEASRNLMPSQEVFDRTNQASIEMRIVKRAEMPSDLCGAVIFLASDASDFISGQTVNCDGGANFY